ncbi:MAG: hypothetical protein K2X82_23555 [Gemmataceae bacterium]|nr:hypothetical protein [Gemmataceae bacterium]
MQKKSHLLPELLTPFAESDRPLAGDEVARRLRAGWRCVRFLSCASFLLATVTRRSGIHLAQTWQSRVFLGLGYSAASLALGPWGVPWGPVETLRAIWTNLTGGVDVTAEVLAHLEAPPADTPSP